jgi:hypothetical protein
MDQGTGMRNVSKVSSPTSKVKTSMNLAGLSLDLGL